MPWTRKRASSKLARLLLEDADERLADAHALGLGIGHARELREEALGRLDVHERHLEVVAERLDDLLGLVLAHQAVVDVDAGQLVADGAVHEQRGHGRVDAAGEAADHARVADLGADQLDLLVDHGERRPRGGRMAGVGEEVLEHVGAARGVLHLGMELHAVEAALGILHRGDRRRGRRGRHAEAVGRAHDGVVVAHPAGVDVAHVVQQHADRGSRARSCRTRRPRCARRRRRAPGPSPACRSRCPAPGSRARAAADRAAARPRRRSRPGRRRG